MMTDPVFSEALRETVFAILEQPTAPFHEDAVAAEITRLLADCPHVTLEQDSFGNLVARYQRGEAPIRFAFAAHMDHPAWVRNEKDEWEFLGGVPEELRTFPRRNEGDFAVWDLPPPMEESGRIDAPACDDLIGCAAIVAMFRELERREVEGACAALFTRAEEVAFIGAMELAESGLIPHDWQILSIEASPIRPPAVMGEGVIVRVGDRGTIFSPRVTAALAATAAAAQIPHQRCLMSGGVCEGTAYTLAGYECGALCVALGNYHNIGPDQRIAPEFVAWRDVRALAALCATLVQSPAEPVSLAARISENRARHQRFHRPLFVRREEGLPLPVRQADVKA